MKATLDVGDLRALVDRVKGALANGDSVPLPLRSVLLHAHAGSLRAVTQNLDGLSIEALVPATITATGSLCVPGKLLADLARKLPEDAECELSNDGATARLQCRRGRYALPSMAPEDFPALAVSPAGAGVCHTRMTAADLIGLIGGVAYAQSKEETRFYLNGVYLHVRHDLGDDPVLRGVATDGHRLARLERPAPVEAAAAPPIIVPRQSVGEILRALEPLGSSSVDLTWSAHLFRLVAGYVTITTKLVDGTYPDYDRVIPARNGPVVEVETAALRAAVDRVATLAGKKGRLDLRLRADELGLFARDPDIGTAEEVIPARWGAAPLTVGYNARYVTDTLSRITGDLVHIDPGDGTGPAILRDPAVSTALFLIMPMKG